jgi:hypothetical protein
MEAYSIGVLDKESYTVPSIEPILIGIFCCAKTVLVNCKRNIRLKMRMFVFEWGVKVANL